MGNQFSWIGGIIGCTNEYFHTRTYICNSHKATDTKLAHQCLNDVFDIINIGRTFCVFAENSLADVAGVINASGNNIDCIRYLFHIINQLKVGIFHLLHGRINDLNMFSELGGIFCNLLYIFTGQSYFFQSYLNQFKCLLNGSSHFSRYFIETGQSVLNLRRRSLCLGAQCTNLFGNNRKAFSGITGTGSFDRSIECKKVCLVGDVVDFSGFFKNHGKLGFEIMKNMFNFRRKFGHRSGCFHKTVEILWTCLCVFLWFYSKIDHFINHSCYIFHLCTNIGCHVHRRGSTIL